MSSVGFTNISGGKNKRYIYGEKFVKTSTYCCIATNKAAIRIYILYRSPIIETSPINTIGVKNTITSNCLLITPAGQALPLPRNAGCLSFFKPKFSSLLAGVVSSVNTV